MYNANGDNPQQGFQWGPFLLGILYLVLGILAFNNPVISIVSIAYVFAIGAIIIGLFQIFARRRIKQFSTYDSTALVFLGVIDIIIGVIFFINIATAVFAIHFLFALWLIIDSIGALVSAGPIKDYSKAQYWLTIVVAIIGLVIGVVLIFNPATSFLTIALLIGIFFTLFGILNIVYAF